MASTETKTKARPPRIDQLTPGSAVVLRFSGEARDETVLFRGVQGSGDTRVACFAAIDLDSARPGVVARSYTWEAYRHKGRWSYGTGADSLSLVEVLREPIH